MKITITDRCFKFLNSWLTRPYSPNLTNADKILANLKRIGHNDREVWANSFDIICNALEFFDLTLVYELAIEKIRLNKEGNLIIDTSFTMLNPDEEPYYASFSLDNTLNLMEEAKEKKVGPEFRLDCLLFDQETNFNIDEIPSVEEIINIEADHLPAKDIEHSQDISLSAEGIEDIQLTIHTNIKPNIINTSLSKSHRSLPFFPQLSKPNATPNTSVNEHLAEQLIRPHSPGIVLD